MQPFGVEERERITVLGGEHLGQVGGLAIGPEPDEQVVIFHRGDRSWNYGYTFLIFFSTGACL
jgi:hypothetical protein